MVMIVGLYLSTCAIINAFDVQVPDGGVRARI
jgi:hypothetical protein